MGASAGGSHAVFVGVALKTELKEQRMLIRKVNEEVELGKRAPQTVLNVGDAIEPYDSEVRDSGPAFFKNGQLRDQVTGVTSKNDLLNRIEALA